jgi:arginyl-tRNA synthetase
MLQSGAVADEEERSLWQKVRRESVQYAQGAYDELGAKLSLGDIRGESEYRGDLGATVEELRRAAHAYAHVATDLPRIRVEGSDKPVTVFHSSAAGQPLFLNKEGEPLPFLIRKSDGAYLYSTTDLAAIRYRVRDLEAHRLIYVTDKRQALHFEMLFATARGAGWTARPDGTLVALEHVVFGSVLGEDGKPLKTRSGDSVKLTDLLKEAKDRALAIVSEKNPELSASVRESIARAVGIGAVKYADLSKDRTSDYVFSWDRMLAMEGNTAPYLQIQHARIKSIFRKGGGGASAGANLILQAPQELVLAKHLIRLGEIIDVASRELKPHQLSTYLYDLATKFSSFYTECPVLKSEEPTRGSRLLLCKLAARTMEIGLDLLGIEHPDEM